MDKEFIATEVTDSAEELQDALNNPPKGYAFHSWNVAYASGVGYYTVVYRRI